MIREIMSKRGICGCSFCAKSRQTLATVKSLSYNRKGNNTFFVATKEEAIEKLIG
ncbi:hypothetical protein ACQQ9V_07825 [Hornefia butyriciproducens]|uniref:hypothetical protein n=1 Tax=Hornefia butyriciproducens TaxID=2652293 RepID=UPI003D06F45A